MHIIHYSNRNNKIDKFRGILELANSVEDNKLFKPYKKVSLLKYTQSSMLKIGSVSLQQNQAYNKIKQLYLKLNFLLQVPYKPNIYVSGFHKTCLTYSNVLMLSEWMIEKPGDFSQNWYVVPCPKGLRLLAIANHVSFILCYLYHF